MPVNGAEDRTLIEDPSVSPWKFVGRWTAHYPNDVLGIASGVLIGNQFVLTAGHVLFGRLGNLQSGSVFSPGYSLGSSPSGSLEFNLSGPNVGYNEDHGRDIALVRLNSNSTIPTKDIPGMVVFMNPADAIGKNISSAGYAGELDNAERMYSESGTIASAIANGFVTFSATVDFGDGQSGAPIFYTYEDNIFSG